MLDLDNPWNAALFAGPISCCPVHQEGQRFCDQMHVKTEPAGRSVQIRCSD